jgi:hypothetical protein
MIAPFKTYRLVVEPSEAGLCCRNDGLTLAGNSLLKHGPRGFEVRAKSELDGILNAVYGKDSTISADAIAPRLSMIACALNANDLARASIGSVLLKLPDVEGVSDTLFDRDTKIGKANFNDAESRNRHGLWTAGGANVIPAQIVIPAPIAPPLTIPGSERPGSKDEDYTFPVAPSQQSAGANDNAHAGTQVTTENQPKLCPDPGPDVPHGASVAAQLYQSQITGLKPGLAVTLNGVTFDGCRESDGKMLEAKGQNLLWMITRPSGWVYVTKMYAQFMGEATRQSVAAGSRGVEWNFAEKPVADFFRVAFKAAGLKNIDVKYEPYNMEIIKYLIDIVEKMIKQFEKDFPSDSRVVSMRGR